MRAVGLAARAGSTSSRSLRQRPTWVGVGTCQPRRSMASWRVRCRIRRRWRRILLRMMRLKLQARRRRRNRSVEAPISSMRQKTWISSQESDERTRRMLMRSSMSFVLLRMGLLRRTCLSRKRSRTTTKGLVTRPSRPWRLRLRPRPRAYRLNRQSLGTTAKCRIVGTLMR